MAVIHMIYKGDSDHPTFRYKGVVYHVGDEIAIDVVDLGKIPTNKFEAVEVVAPDKKPKRKVINSDEDMESKTRNNKA